MADPVTTIRRLISYNPGPGLYSRMSRAVERMPSVIRTQELPGLLRKYPEGVPGWEVGAVAPALEGVQSIPRQDLLELIQQHSPAYTHGELLLQGKMEPRPLIRPEGFFHGVSPGQLTGMRPLGRGVAVGDTKFQDFGQGGDNYGELLLIQPGADGQAFGSHWGSLPGGMLRARAANSAVAHARFDTHGDALRINELQSDLGIHNRKRREVQGDYLKSAGSPPQSGWIPELQTLPFPLEDAWADILIKRIALEAARKGHRAIEVASPLAIADKVGGNIDNYEHFYGKVVPGAIERLGRKMGGLTPGNPPAWAGGYDEVTAELLRRYDEPTGRALELLVGARKDFRGAVPAFAHTPGDRFDDLAHSYLEDQADVLYIAKELHQGIIDDMVARGADSGTAQQRAADLMPQLMRLAEEQASNAQSYRNVRNLGRLQSEAWIPKESAPRRYLMSDEMRRRILQQGIGLGVLGGMASMQDEE